MKLHSLFLRVIAVTALLLLCAGLSWSATGWLPQFAAARVVTAPVMDGRLDDPAWSKATETGGFAVLGSPASRPRVATYVKALTDGKALYLGFRCVEPRMSDVETKILPRDVDTWMQESIEIVFDANGDGLQCYHLICNVSGDQFDSKVTRFLTGASNEDDKWNGDWELKTSKGDKEWFAELRLPFSTFGVDLSRNSVFRIEFGRGTWIGKQEYSTWAMNRVSFIEPENMGELIIPNADSSYCQVKLPRLASIGTGSQSVPFEVVNHSGSPIRPKLAYKIVGTQTSSGDIQLETLAAGRTSKSLLPLKLNGPGSYTLLARAVDTVSGKDLYSLRREIEATQPIAFDEALYALYQKRADAMVYVRVPVEGARLKVSLLKDGAKSPAAVKILDFRYTGPTKVSFDLSRMGAGTYRMCAELISAGKSSALSYSRPYTYNPNPRTGFGKDGLMMVDGKPFFPVGIYSLQARDGSASDEIMNDARQAGFNTTVLYADDFSKLLPLLDACKRNVIKAFVYPTVPFSLRKGDETPSTIRRDIDLRKNHPAVVGWYVVDEPEGIGLAPVQPVRDLYQLIKEYDSQHPCALVVMSAGAAKDYKASTDIMWADPYPVPKQSVTVVSDVVAGSIRNIEKDKPMWSVVQAFDWSVWDNGKLNGKHRPTPEEERCMTYLALVNGAKGIIYWAHCSAKYYIRDYPEHWNAIKKIAGELRDLTPILITPTVKTKLWVSPKNEDIQTMLKRVNGQWYLFAVNSGLQQCEESFHVQGGAVGQKTDVLFEGRSLAVIDGEWKDSFKPLEVHVYRMDAR